MYICIPDDCETFIKRRSICHIHKRLSGIEIGNNLLEVESRIRQRRTTHQLALGPTLGQEVLAGKGGELPAERATTTATVSALARGVIVV